MKSQEPNANPAWRYTEYKYQIFIARISQEYIEVHMYITIKIKDKK